MSGHRSKYNSWINGSKYYCKSFEIQKYGDAYIELIIEVEVQSKPDLRRIEGEHQRATLCINTQIAGQTRQEWYELNKEHIIERDKKYRELNREKILEKAKVYREENREIISKQQKKHYDANKEEYSKQKKIYRENNKAELNVKDKIKYEINREKILEKAKEKITCECGSICRKVDISKHKKTKNHIKYLEDNKKEFI
jgi:hypothetical protein